MLECISIMTSLIEETREYAREIGIHALAVCTAEPDEEAALSMIQRYHEGLVPEDLFSGDAEIRKLNDPLSFMPTARSVIVAALSYNVAYAEKTHDEPYGSIAPYVRANYYRALRKKLEKLSSFLKNKTGSSRFFISSNGLIREKPFARRSGLGFYGKNGVIVAKEWGSLVVLGLLMTELELPPGIPARETCGSCEQCIRACPTGALEVPGVITLQKCLHYCAYREHMPLSLRESWGTRFFGCSACLEACPMNIKAAVSDCMPSYGFIGRSLPLLPFLDLEENEWKTRFRGSQLGARWVSISALKKNIIVAMGNHGDRRAVEPLERFISSAPENLKEHARWALAKLKNWHEKT